MYHYRVNKLCMKLVIETSLHDDARSGKHQIMSNSVTVKNSKMYMLLFYLMCMVVSYPVG
jgi:hypothetical protein